MADKRKILITGTSSGFGLGAAKALAERGHTVYATMRGVDGKNKAVATELKTWAGSKHPLEVHELDVTQDASVARAVDTILGRAGTLDVLLNNAGVGTWGLQEGFTSQQVKDLFDVNVVGMLRMNRAVVPHMRKHKAGYIVYTSSGLGRILLPFLGPYTASKYAVEAIAEISSYELAPSGIDTTILQPGAYGTAFLVHSIQPVDAKLLDEQPALKKMYEAFAGGFEERAKAGHLGNPQEIIDAMVELVELPRDQRPLRKTVGADVQQPVNALNAAHDQVQHQLLTMFGLR
jgi:NAD(P)-dependent dehydrogenase (short-subunit alcohol dehydrogenase family)